MLFNSYLFIFIFLPLSVFGFYFLSRYKNSKILVNFLLIISIIFYSIGNFQDLPLIIFSVVINFILGKIIFNSNNTQKTYILIIGLAFNLLILYYCNDSFIPLALSFCFAAFVIFVQYHKRSVLTFLS